MTLVELPCAFCGSENRNWGSWIDQSVIPHERMHYISCQDCHARGPSVLMPDRMSAPVTEAWNKALRPGVLTFTAATPDPNQLVTDHICQRHKTPKTFCDYCFQQNRYPKGHKHGES